VGKPALAGRRVLELGVYIAGPFAGRMLAQLGAEVVKVESPRGDPARTEASHAAFVAHNAGKKSVVVDLRSAEGREVFDRLVEVSDVVLTNLAPDALRHLEMSYERCARVNPDIVYCHVKGYGPGPRQDEIATNPMVEAANGSMHRNRVNGRPTRQGMSFYDMTASAYAVVGILAGLMAPRGDQASRDIQIGLYETGLYLAAASVVGEQYRQHAGERPVGEDPTSFARPGYGAYETADGRWIYLLMLTDAQWREFCEVMELPDANDETLSRASQRAKRVEYVEATVRAAIKALTFEQATSRLSKAGFGSTEVRAPEDVLKDDQVLQPGKLVTSHYDGLTFRIPNLPIVSAAVRNDLNDQEEESPLLGEHTRELLQIAGYDSERSSELINRGVVVDGPAPVVAPAAAR
jgi:crotonobetainyl-CoA:carnitine CoA-transferase CaiB-like acyl-CoA transferase